MPQPVRKRSDGLETMGVVKRFARKELDQHGPVQFNLDRVLEKSGVARSSVYHHFGSRNELIATIEAERYVEEVMAESEAMRAIFYSCKDRDAVLRVVENALAMDGGKTGRRRRRRRLSLLVAAEHNAVLERAMIRGQIEGTAHFIETITRMVERGVVVATAPIPGIAHFMQSVFVGRILVDMTNDESLDRDWVTTTMVAIRAFFVAP